MKTNKSFQLNIPISKVDEEQRIVTGIATDETLDSQGDIVDYEASKKAFGAWPGNIREMHGPVAIGKGIDVQFDDDSKQVIVSAKISESADGENAWIKVKEKILTGFSIGGRVFEVAKDKTVSGAQRILDYSLSELSLVDNPANPSAELLMVKSANGGLQRVEEDRSDELLPTSWWAAKFMGAPMQKSVYDASEALSLATQLTWLIMSEADEPDQQADLVTAFNALRDFAAKEVAEGDDFDWMQSYAEVVELANKAINLRKGKNVTDVKKTNVVGGEERNHEAQVTQSAEQAGRPVNDTTERANEAGVPTPGEAVVDSKGTPKKDEDGNVVVQPEQYATDDKTKTPDDTARNDITPPEDKKVVDPKEVTEPTNTQTLDAEGETVNDTKENRSPAIATPANPDKPVEDGKVVDEKADTATDLIKNVQALLTKFDNANSDDLKKMSDAVEKLNDKVEKSMTALEDRIKAIEAQPIATKAKQYHVIGKGDDEEISPEVADLQKRQEHLMKHPMDAEPGEAEAIYKGLKAAQVGERIVIK